LPAAPHLTRTSDDVAWTAAGGLSALILCGYVLSRSVGLPGFTNDTGEWSEALGLASMVVETQLVLLTAVVLVSRRYPSRRAVAGSSELAGANASGMQPGPAVG
jgi:hypothetical protein